MKPIKKKLWKNTLKFNRSGPESKADKKKKKDTYGSKCKSSLWK